MRHLLMALLGALAMGLAAGANAEQTWKEGTHYVRLSLPQRTSVPAGKIEVMEVFSYGCPWCNQFAPVADKIRRTLPANAQMTYLPASFSTSEDFPVFQRAYFAAQVLGIAEQTHQAIFDAVWKTGELAVLDPVTHQLKRQLPTNRRHGTLLAEAHRRDCRQVSGRSPFLHRRRQDEAGRRSDPRHASHGHPMHHRQRQVPSDHGKPRQP